ncbi:hypothetical protein CapIbe_000037 [Capra ibex]
MGKVEMRLESACPPVLLTEYCFPGLCIKGLQLNPRSTRYRMCMKKNSCEPSKAWRIERHHVHFTVGD